MLVTKYYISFSPSSMFKPRTSNFLSLSSNYFNFL